MLKKVADVSDFWWPELGYKKIVSLDANLTACRDKREVFQQYAETGCRIDFSQGLDIRLLDDDDIADLNRMRLCGIHFAWDDPETDLTERFQNYARKATHKPHGAFGTVYVLTNYNSTLEQDLYRIYKLRELGFDPDVRIYNKPDGDREHKRLQRWCNNKRIFKSCEKFEDYIR